jgi:hypothetical protein
MLGRPRRPVPLFSGISSAQIHLSAGVTFWAALMIGDAVAEQRFSWTGTYEGFFVCDDVTDGVPSSFGRPMTVRIVQTGDRLDLALDSDVGPSTALYRGAVRTSPRGDMVSGFVKACVGPSPTRSLFGSFRPGRQWTAFALPPISRPGCRGKAGRRKLQMVPRSRSHRDADDRKVPTLALRRSERLGHATDLRGAVRTVRRDRTSAQPPYPSPR